VERSFMKFENIEESYNNYLLIENQLTLEERLKFLKGFQELIKLYKLNMSLEDMAETM
jgi:hypothetical protein